MALQLVGGAVLGVLFDQLRKEIRRVKDNIVMFKPKLEELEETLTVLYPVIEEIEELNRLLNRPNHGRETIILRRLLEDGTKLVSMCSKVPRWNFLKQSRYREKLVELDNKILRFHNLYLQAHMGRDQKQTLLFVQETRQMMIMSLNQQGFSNLTMGFTDSSHLTPASSTGSYFKVYKSGSFERSLDITKFSNYIQLRRELACMFGLEGELEDPVRSGWRLVFVDQDNDILLLGEDPWPEFVNSAWCMNILSVQEVQQMACSIRIRLQLKDFRTAHVKTLSADRTREV